MPLSVSGSVWAMQPPCFFITDRTIVMCVPLMFWSLAGRIAFWLRDGDNACFAAKHAAIIPPLRMRSMFSAVVPAPLTASTATLAWHYHSAVLYWSTLFCAVSTLYKSVLTDASEAATPILHESCVLQGYKLAFVRARSTFTNNNNGVCGHRIDEREGER